MYQYTISFEIYVPFLPHWFSLFNYVSTTFTIRKSNCINEIYLTSRYFTMYISVIIFLIKKKKIHKYS